jgi:hypothetical protein
MVAGRLNAVGLVLSSLREVGPRLAVQAQDVFSPYLREGEALPDFQLMAVLIERLVVDRARRMEEADTRHNEELADDAAPREARDDAAHEVFGVLIEIKQGVAALFGEAWQGRLKLPREVPQDPSALFQLAEEVRSALSTAELPKPRLSGVTLFDRRSWIEALAEPTARLGAALSDVSREAREARGTLVERGRAIAGHDVAFSTGVAFVAALLRLFGEHAHADRLRPSIRAPGTLEADEPAAGGSGPDDR